MASSTPPPPPPPPPSGPPHDAGPQPRARIRRDTDGGVVGGVAAGFARFLDVDVVWIRLAFVLLTLLGGGTGIVIYLVAWIVIPSDEDDPAAAGGRTSGTAVATSLAATEGGRRRGAFWTGVALVTVGGIVLFDTLLSPLMDRLPWTSPTQVLLPLALIAIGVLIYRSSREGDLRLDLGLDLDRERRAEYAERIETVAETLGDDVESWAEGFGERVDAFVGEVDRTVERIDADLKVRASTLRRLRSANRVAPATFGVALLVLGGLWLASELGAPVPLAFALSATLLVIGLGLLVGAFLGRGRGLVVAAALLVPVVALATQFPTAFSAVGSSVVFDDGVWVVDGERAEPTVLRPTGLDELPDRYELGVGDVTVDLRGLGDAVGEAGTVRLTVEFGVGNLRVLLPPGVEAVVRVDLGIGRVVLPQGSSGGLGVSRQETLPAADGARGRIELTISQGIGNVEVTR